MHPKYIAFGRSKSPQQVCSGSLRVLLIPASVARTANAFVLSGLLVLTTNALAGEPYHLSTEAEIGHDCCYIFQLGWQNMGKAFPEWEAVQRFDPDFQPDRTPSVILEGIVMGPGYREDVETAPHVSFEDLPFSHYTHDFCFKVLPDPAFRHLLGIQQHGRCMDSNGNFIDILDSEGHPVDCLYCPDDHDVTPGCPDGYNCVTTVSTQSLIEVEWECGLGSDNNDNPCHIQNEAGVSGGFFSAGHRRYDTIWQWPTAGDRVHVEGFWIWDRGHPPADTEIHPPRLVAVQRKFPTIYPPWVQPWTQEGFTLATRMDIFASGDGGALRNNRGLESFAKPVIMSEKDYSFKMKHTLPKPSPSAHLIWQTSEIHFGDTFPGSEAIIQTAEDEVLVTIPWKTIAAPDTCVFARTICLYWSTDSPDDFNVSHGVSADYHPRIFKVTLARPAVQFRDGLLDMLETRSTGDAEIRLFLEVGGSWIMANEFACKPDPADGCHWANILEDGIGDTGNNDSFDLTYEDGTVPQFAIVLPPGENFRMHADGWESDGIGGIMGLLYDPYSACDAGLWNYVANTLATGQVGLEGAQDDPIGEVNHTFVCGNINLGPQNKALFQDQTVGPMWKDIPTVNEIIYRDGVFTLNYQIEELSWTGSDGSFPLGGVCANCFLDAFAIYVDSNYAGGNDNGGPSAPYHRLMDAYNSAQDCSILRIKAGAYLEAPFNNLSKHVRLESIGGPTIIR